MEKKESSFNHSQASFSTKNELTSSRHNLSKSDRALLSAYLGYKKTIQLPYMHVKNKEDACLFVSSALWSQNGQDDEIIDETDFDLTSLLENEKLPSIFKTKENDLKIMFQEAHEFGDEQQIACIRSFMVSFYFFWFEKNYLTNIKIWIVVSMARVVFCYIHIYIYIIQQPHTTEITTQIFSLFSFFFQDVRENFAARFGRWTEK